MRPITVRALLQPPVVLTILGAAFTRVRLPEGERLEFFTIIVLTGIGATELAFFANDMWLRRGTAMHRIGRALSAIGSLLLAFGILRDIAVAPIVIGAVSLFAGARLRVRAPASAMPTDSA
jgi:hypothetical protein